MRDDNTSQIGLRGLWHDLEALLYSLNYALTTFVGNSHVSLPKDELAIDAVAGKRSQAQPLAMTIGVVLSGANGAAHKE